MLVLQIVVCPSSLHKKTPKKRKRHKKKHTTEIRRRPGCGVVILLRALYPDFAVFQFIRYKQQPLESSFSGMSSTIDISDSTSASDIHVLNEVLEMRYDFKLHS
jgi:hypothetical protein